MASGDQFAQAKPQELCSDNGPLSQPLLPVSPAVFANGAGGVPLGKEDGYTFLFRVPVNGTPLSTGLTVSAVVADDPNNPGAGLNVVLGATIVPVPTATGVLSDPATTNEVTATVTVSATEGDVTVASIAVANSHLSSLAAGNWALVRIRRVGSNTADTHPGRVILAGVTISDT